MGHSYLLKHQEIDKTKSIEENFIDALKAERSSDVEFYNGIDIYWHLFKVLYPYCPTFLSGVVEDYNKHPNWWFCNFHKQFRQCDMYNGIGFFDRRISEEKKEERKNLIREKNKYLYENAPKSTGFKSEDEWLQKEKDFYDNDVFLKENKAKLKLLNTSYNSFEMKESFCGNMDMIMWLTIDNDKESVLNRFMDEFMKMYLNLELSDS